MRSARNRILASKRADVGSIFVVSTLPFTGELVERVPLRSAIDPTSGLITVYQPGGRAQSGRHGKRQLLSPTMDPFDGLRNRVRGNGVDQSDRESLRGADLLGGHEDFEGPAFSDQARQSLGPSPARDQAKSCAAMSENRVWGRNPAVASQRQIEAATHAVPGNRGIDWSREVLDCCHKRLPARGKLVSLGCAERCYFVQFRSRRKESLVSSDHQRRRIPSQKGDCLG